MELEFINFTQYSILKEFFNRVLREIQMKEKVKKNSFLGVVLVGKARIRNINKRYRGKNQVTEALSFSFTEIKKPTKKGLQFIEPREVPKNLGEVLLCPNQIKKQADRLKKNFEEHLASVFIHSVLHLLGYKHKDTENTKEMRKKEKEILTSFLQENKIKNSKEENSMGERRKSFTLVEVIIASSIIMILTGLLFVSASEIRTQGRDSLRIQHFDLIVNALENYYNKEGCYPYGDGPECGPGKSWEDMCNTLRNAGFLGECPKDPGSFDYEYCVDLQDSQGTKYTLKAQLERASQALHVDYDRDWPEECPAEGCPADQPNRCCKCRAAGGSCNPNPPPLEEKYKEHEYIPYTYCVRNP